MNDSVDRSRASGPDVSLTPESSSYQRVAGGLRASLLLRMLVCGVIVFVTLVLGPPGWQPSDAALAQSATNRAAVVVQFPGGKVDQACVGFDQGQISGYELLKLSNMTLITATSSMGIAVCKIGGIGCDVSNCLTCQGNTYWSYWRVKNGNWAYSNVGAYAAKVDPGGVDGWVWGIGNAPPPTTFEQVCSATVPSPTPIPASATAVATSTTLSTATVVLTATPITPSATPQPTQTRPPSIATWTWTAVPPTQTSIRTNTPVPPTATSVPPVASATQPNAIGDSRSAQATVIPIPASSPPNATGANAYPMPSHTLVAGASSPWTTSVSIAGSPTVVVMPSANQSTLSERVPERSASPATAVPSPQPGSPSPSAGQFGTSSHPLIPTQPVIAGSPPSGAPNTTSQFFPVARESERASDAPVPTIRPRATISLDGGQRQSDVGNSTTLSRQDEARSLLIQTPRPFGAAVAAPGSVAWAHDPAASGLRPIGSAASFEAAPPESRAGQSEQVVNTTQTMNRGIASIGMPPAFTWGHLTFAAMSLGLLGFLTISMRTR